MSGEFDRLKAAVFGLIEVALRRVDYYALYPSKIIKQDAQGRLELQPEDVRLVARLPGLTSVPIRLGLPGCKVTVRPGGRVLLGFEGGDPQAPVALLWDATSVELIQMVADEIRLGSDTPVELQFVALSEKVDAGFASLREAILAHIHPTAVGPSAITTLALPPLDSTAGSVAKAKV